MPKGFSEREKELIGQCLLEQGYRLFSAYGLKKTNVEEIARAAGISKGAFYNFYASKEALFMDVVEEAEVRLRQELLAAVDLPGPSPRARLLAVMRKAFSLLETIPILQFLTGSDFDLLFRRMPPGKLQQHLANDRAFLVELIARCRQAGIPIQAQPDQIIGLLYPLVLAILHAGEFGPYNFSGSLDLLLELVATYCLGEVEIEGQAAVDTAPGPLERNTL
jgi:AcrR family transcriptional regulator